MEHLNDILELVSEQLSSVASSDAVVGVPIELGSVTVVPLSRVSIGFGGGGGEGEGSVRPHQKSKKKGGPTIELELQPGKGQGGGSGGGAKVRPVAVIVFGEDGVQILPIPNKRGKLHRLLDKIPDLVERVKEATDD
jgi:uncharacterized spore protein YtfJ